MPPNTGQHQERLTWPLLLAKWTEFAKAAVALPDDADGRRWREALPAIINLQAVTHALEELDDHIDDDERPVALDKAEILIRSAAGDIHAAWAAEPLPDGVAAAVADARDALAEVRGRAWVWFVTGDRLVADHPAEVQAAAAALGFRGLLLLPAPGVPLFESCPAACLRPSDDQPAPPELLAIVSAFLGEAVDGPARAEPVQAYRQLDFARGGPVRDLVAPLDGEPMPGQPLLVTAMDGGETAAVSMPPRGGRPIDPVPVEYLDEPGPD